MTATAVGQTDAGPSRLRSVLGQRRILGLLIGRDLKVRYADSTLGYLWSVLEPLLMAGVYWFVFTKIFPRGSAAENPYIVFLLLGLLPWNWANAVMTGASKAIAGEAKLVRSVDVPREIWVLRIVGSKFFEFLFSIPVVVFFMIVLHEGVNRNIAWVPVAMAMEWVALTGIALILAPVTVMMTDVDRLVRIVVRMLFYLSPVLYSKTQILGSPTHPVHVPKAVKEAYTFNPFTAILSLYRCGVYRSEMPSLDLAIRGSFVSLVLFLVGIWVFRKLEPAVLKEI
ncbi:MAG TPA: ABC transporter permease [Sporichthyaceae bacterium]|jgi:ABC-2 type transport system permease protein|nr:ABC transporter permease [Sporichthyaceae bacterium]